MAENDIPSSIHQTIGSLNAKADQAAKDVSDLRQQAARDIGELRIGQGDLKAQIGALPSTIRDIINDELSDRLKQIDSRIVNIEATVNRWKGVLLILSAIAGSAGWLLSHLSIRKVFGE